MIIFADSNEEATNPRVIEELRKHFTKLQITSLAFGDMNIILDNGDLIAIERKNAGDFLGSIGDGRVFKQVENMAQSAKFYCVILVGSLIFDKDDLTVAAGRETGWKGSAVRAALMAIQWSGCPILSCSSTEMFPFAVEEVIRFCSKPAEHLQSIGHRRIVTFPPLELSTEILAAFPGVGIKRAQALIDFVSTTPYNSLGGALAWASVFPLIKEGGRPAGWGDKTVENFRGLLGLEPNQFLQIKEDKNVNTKKR